MNAQIRRGTDSPCPYFRFLMVHRCETQLEGRELWNESITSKKAGRSKQSAQSVGAGFNYSETRSVRFLVMEGRCIVCGLLDALYASKQCLFHSHNKGYFLGKSFLTQVRVWDGITGPVLRVLGGNILHIKRGRQTYLNCFGCSYVPTQQRA